MQLPTAVNSDNKVVCQVCYLVSVGHAMLCNFHRMVMLASIQGRLKYGLVPIAGVIVRMRFKLPRIWVIVLRT